MTTMNSFQPVVEIEETIYSYTPANNGAGPLWGHGNTCIVRHGDDVFVSGLETLSDVKPLNNVRWLLFKRDNHGWNLVQSDEKELQREPCPLGVFSDGRVLLSTNPTLAELNTYEGPANPHLLQFDGQDLSKSPSVLQPKWSQNPGFSEHSYRGMAVDGKRNEAAMFNNFGYHDQYWAFLNSDGKWANCGVNPFPIRCCYQNIALKDGVCQMQAVSDIMEPNETWREWKKRLFNGRPWDYVFRYLYYMQNPDISAEQFSEPLEIDNVEETAGHFRNLDLWIGEDGAAHLLYLKKNIALLEMRDQFFPGVSIETSIEYCIVRDNEVVRRQTLLKSIEGEDKTTPVDARLHSTPDGRLFVLYSCVQQAGSDEGEIENRICELTAGGELSPSFKLDVERPLTLFVTANERGGSAPSHVLDVYGSAAAAWGASLESDDMRYLRIRIPQ